MSFSLAERLTLTALIVQFLRTRRCNCRFYDGNTLHGGACVRCRHLETVKASFPDLYLIALETVALEKESK